MLTKDMIARMEKLTGQRVHPVIRRQLIPCAIDQDRVASASDIMSLISEQLPFLTAPEQAHFVEALKSVALCLRHPVAFQNVEKLDSTFRDAVAGFLVPYLVALCQDGVAEAEEEEWSLSAMVDTVYCKCLVLLGDEAAYEAQLEALLSGAGSNECVVGLVAECEQLLKQSQLSQRLACLVRLYESYGQHKAVLARKRAERITKSPHELAITVSVGLDHGERDSAGMSAQVHL